MKRGVDIIRRLLPEPTELERTTALDALCGMTPGDGFFQPTGCSLWMPPSENLGSHDNILRLARAILIPPRQSLHLQHEVGSSQRTLHLRSSVSDSVQKAIRATFNGLFSSEDE